MSDLLFELSQTASPDLLFGETAAPVDIHTEGTVAVTLPGMTFSAVAAYQSGTARPIVGASKSDWQGADKVPAGAVSTMDAAQPVQSSATPKHTSATKVLAGVETVIPDTLMPAPVFVAEKFGGAARAESKPYTAGHRDADHSARLSRTSVFQGAAKVGTQRAVKSQDALHDRRASRKSRTGHAEGLYLAVSKSVQSANPFDQHWLAGQQNAIKPPAGMYVRPTIVPPTNTCYTPNGNMFFGRLADGSDLLFICDNYVEPAKATIAVPVRRA